MHWLCHINEWCLEKETPEHSLHAWTQKGVGRGPDPLENNKAIGFLSNTGPDPLEIHKDTKPVLYVEPPSARW